MIPHRRNANHAVYIDQPLEMSLALDKNGGKSLVSNSISVRRSNIRTTAKDVYKPKQKRKISYTTLAVTNVSLSDIKFTCVEVKRAK